MKQDYFLSKLFLVFILLLSAFKIEAVEKTLGYCPDEIPDNVKKSGQRRAIQLCELRNQTSYSYHGRHER